MPAKTKTIKLRFVRTALTKVGKEDSFKVVSLTNSTRYNPGEILTKPQVDDLCRASGWSVSIVGLADV